jgi:hypothetical protein
MTEEVEVSGIVAAGEEGNNFKNEEEEEEVGTSNHESKQGKSEAEQKKQTRQNVRKRLHYDNAQRSPANCAWAACSFIS